jgi:hypothetical protein
MIMSYPDNRQRSPMCLQYRDFGRDTVWRCVVGFSPDLLRTWVARITNRCNGAEKWSKCKEHWDTWGRELTFMYLHGIRPHGPHDLSSILHVFLASRPPGSELKKQAAGQQIQEWRKLGPKTEQLKSRAQSRPFWRPSSICEVR